MGTEAFLAEWSSEEKWIKNFNKIFKKFNSIRIAEKSAYQKRIYWMIKKLLKKGKNIC